MRKLDMISARFQGEDGSLTVARVAGSGGLQVHLDVDRREGGFLLLEGDEPLRLRDMLVSLYPGSGRRDRKDVPGVRFPNSDGEALSFAQTNRGEPYREGVQVSFDLADYEYWGSLFLEEDEVRRLRDLLNKLYPAEA